MGEKAFSDALNCLIYNEKLCNLISEAIKNIDHNIDSLSDTQEYLLSQINREDIDCNYVLQMINGENMCHVRKPFFSSNNGLIPFTSKTDIKRQQEGSHDYYMIKIQLNKLCTESDVEALKVAVGKNIYDIEFEKLIRSSDKRANKQIKTLKLSSPSDLLYRCDSDMIDRIDWMTIASQDLKGKITHTDCRRLWDKVLNPEYVYTKWTESESQTLLQLASELGCQGKWVNIASQLPIKRQPFMCYRRWLELTSKMETSDEWNTEEDSILCQAVVRTNEKMATDIKINWNKLSLLVPNRSSKDCEKRWNSLQVPINTRPFNDDDDYQMLLLIKKMGTESWMDIAHEMKQRTSGQCQKRYCDIVEELHPWCYYEDRRLWLVLRPYFRNLWSENNQVLDTTMNLATYKSVMKGFNNRCPFVLRHRYTTLCKWFHLWNKFYLSLNPTGQKNQPSNSRTTSLLSESSEERMLMINKILKIILRTSFFDRIRHALRSIGAKDPDSEAHELITGCKNGNSDLLNKLIKDTANQKLMDLLMFIIDLQSGVFVPTKFEEYINISSVGLKYPEKAKNNLRVLSSKVRSFGTKTAISVTLRRRLTALLNNDNVTVSDRKCIEKILCCEGKFSSALNFATTTLERNHQFKIGFKVDLLNTFLPQFLRLMIHYVYNEERRETFAKDIAIHFISKLSSRREQISELLIYRDCIPSIYKTYMSSKKKEGCLSTMLLPTAVSIKLMKDDRLLLCKLNSKKIYKSQQKYPLEDVAVLSRTHYNDNDIDIPLLPPSKCSLNFLRAFILQKQTLTLTGDNAFTDMIKLRYDNPVEYLHRDSSLETPLVVDRSSILLRDPRYILLRSRLLSILSLPSIIARISPSSCAFSSDKLHQEQNNVVSSTEISDYFHVINLTHCDFDIHERDVKECTAFKYTARCRKRKILESVDDDLVHSVFEDRRNIKKVDQSHPFTRRYSDKWFKLLAHERRWSFFVAKESVEPLFRGGFLVDSINGVKVQDFVE